MKVYTAFKTVVRGKKKETCKIWELSFALDREQEATVNLNHSIRGIAIRMEVVVRA